MKSQYQNRMLTFVRLFAVIMMMWILSAKVLASPAQLTYQGRILKTDGTPLEYNNVSFLFQITNPSGSCVIYQEQVTGYNMVNSGGVFDVPIGAGSVQYPLGVASILDAFNNSSTFTCGVCTLSGGSYTCSDGSSSYAAADGDQRKLRVSFYDGSGWRTISPDSIIRSVPFAGYALSAQKLGNNIASDFLVKAGIPTCATGTFLSWNGSALSCANVSGATGGTVTNVTSSNSYLSVVNGSSIPTLTLNVGTTANTVAAGNDSRLTNALQTGTTAGGDLTGTLPSPTIAKIQGVSVNANAPASGEFFKFNGTNWTSSVVSTSDVNGLSTTLNSYLTQSAFNGYVASASCTSGQTMYWNSVSGNFQCQSVSVASSQVNFGAQAANTVFAAPIAGGTPSFRALDPTDMPAGTLSGAGTAGYVPYYNTSTALANSSMYVNGSKLGIGTTSPGATVDIQTTGSTSLRVGVNNPATAAYPTISMEAYGADLGTYPTFAFKSAGGTSTAPLVTSSGLVLGIITGQGQYDTTPGHFRTGADLMFMSSAAYTSSSNPGYMVFRTTQPGQINPTERLRIDPSGNIGVGTTSPVAKLHIGSNPTATANYPLFALGSGAFDGTTAGFFTGNANGTVVGINTTAAYTGDFLNFQIGGVSKYKVDNSGNITSSGNVVSSGNTTSTGNYTTTGNISTTGSGSLTSSGQLSANSGAVSTSPTTGALVVTGGAGVSGALNVGSTISAASSITSGSVFKAAFGTAGAPSYTYTSDITTGSFSPSAGVWAVSTGGTERFRVTGSGNVGVGTSSPSGTLDVENGSSTANICLNGSCIASWSAAGTSPKYYAEAVNVPTAPVASGTSAVAIGSGAQATGQDSIAFGTTNTSSNTQTVAIGYHNSVSASGASAFGSNITNSVGNSTMIGPSDTAKVTILSNGNVGIGTQTPGAKLDVNGGIHPGSATTGASCSGTSEGTFAYDPTAHAPVYCSSSNVWTSIGGGISSCPSGFTLVGPAGGANSFCVSTATETATTYWSAWSTCAGKNTGGRGYAKLCSTSDWIVACNHSGISGFNSPAQWVEDASAYDLAAYNSALLMGGASCSTVNTDISTNSDSFRCCFH